MSQYLTRTLLAQEKQDFLYVNQTQTWSLLYPNIIQTDWKIKQETDYILKHSLFLPLSHRESAWTGFALVTWTEFILKPTWSSYLKQRLFLNFKQALYAYLK